MGKKVGYLVVSIIMLSVATSQAEITVSGSTTVQPLAEIWASEFNKLHQDYHISVHGGGSENGILDIVKNKSDIGMVSRKIRKHETDLKKFQIFLVGHDAICVVVSKNVYDAGVRGLTKGQVKQIYEGKIRNWRDVGGPDHEIFLTAREPGSGTRNTFDQFIFGTNQSIPKNVSVSYSYANEAILANLVFSFQNNIAIFNR